MNSNNQDDKEFHKSLPLDLARSQLTTARTIEGKSPLIMSNQTIRGMRVLAQGISSNGSQTAGQTIITTNIVPQILKQEPVRSQITNIINTSGQSSEGPSQSSTSITPQRPSQVTFTSTTLAAQSLPPGTTYHVPRGPAVVANLAAPRGNVASVRTPMILTAPTASQAHSFVRPPRAPSPAQGTAWLNTNTSNGSQIKGAPTVLSSPVRGAFVTGKPSLSNRTQPSTQGVQSLKPATILHSAITIGQTGQISSLRTSQGPPAVTLNNTDGLSQVLSPRTQGIVHNPSSTNQNIPARISGASAVQNQRAILRPTYVSSGKVTVTASQINSNRLISPQGTVLTTASRISTLPAQPQNALQMSNTATRIATTPQAMTINRLTGSASIAQNTSGNNLGSARILHSIVAVANSQARNIYTSGTKVITQSTPGTIHLTPLSAPIKSTQSNLQGTTRTNNVPATLVVQRSTAAVSTQSTPIARGLPHENTQNNVFINDPVPSNMPPRAPPSPTGVTQANSLVPTTTVAAYTLGGGTYFYDASGNHSISRSFGQQPSNLTGVTQASQTIRSSVIGTQMLGMVTNQQTMRYNSVMVVEQSRNQQHFNSDFNQDQTVQQTPLINRTTASPRPSILRKRDHEGNSVKVAKNLNNVLASLPSRPQANQLPLSPPPRPDSRENENSSGGSTTISATSSPGQAEDDCTMPTESENHKDVKPALEMSPRKKPRKQQLTGNELDEHNDDMQFISDNMVKKGDDSDVHSDEPKDGAPEAYCIPTVRKPVTASLLNSYKHNWKSTHNHFMRYSDVKPKEERKPSIIDLANQFRIQDKINGWKIFHLSTQMDDLAELEQVDYENLSDFLKCLGETGETGCEKDINRVNELIKGNLQRIKIIKEGILEAKSQMMKVFDHKSQVTNLINRCASKRNFKKKVMT
ncbi:histone deacetylase complex subunit SAP130 isoform X2 [Coccinella septempunctata]|uniref:histone deacetylase complex subunit SAP130 isoform X2 n=1 Tax=Coccinella septempunctata TaxID=41139 RepID=UPI001D081D55|nr:histone deacetylase complex subunit SAP130 isoform X2 [Coccinella septempunctata]